MPPYIVVPHPFASLCPGSCHVPKVCCQTPPPTFLTLPLLPLSLPVCVRRTVRLLPLPAGGASGTKSLFPPTLLRGPAPDPPGNTTSLNSRLLPPRSLLTTVRTSGSTRAFRLRPPGELGSSILGETHCVTLGQRFWVFFRSMLWHGHGVVRGGEGLRGRGPSRGSSSGPETDVTCSRSV